MDLRKMLISNKIKNLIKNETKILSFGIISILIASMLTCVDGIVNSDNQKQTILDDKILTKSSIHHPNNFQVSLTENIKLSENLSPKDDHLEQSSTAYTYSISLPEKMLLFGNHNVIKNVAIINQNLDPKTTMDKISNNDRIRFHGRVMVVDNSLFNIQTPITLSQLENSFVQHTENNIIPPIEKILYASLISNISLEYNDINTVSQIIQTTEYNITLIDHVATDPKNSTILVLLIPLSGYILFRTREEKFQFFKSKQVLSCCVIIMIFIASDVLIPAFADCTLPDCAVPETGMTFDESAAASVSYSTSSSESPSFSDTVDTTSEHQSSVSESPSFSDTVSASVEHPSLASESPSFSDTVSVGTVDHQASSSESPSFSDTVDTTSEHQSSVSESPSFSDTVSVPSSDHQVSIIESDIAIVDSVTKSLNPQPSISESASLTDKATTSGIFFHSTSESISISDSSTAAKNLQSNQQLVESAISQITVDPNTPNLVVVSSNAALSTVVIPSTVTTPIIDYNAIACLSACPLQGTTVTIPNALTVSQYTNGITTLNDQITIPAGTKISGSDYTWDGRLNLPTIKSTSSVTAPTQTGVTNTVTQVIEVGFGSTQLSLTHAAKLVLVGSAGQHVGFAHGGPVTEITTKCSDDTQTTNDLMAAGTACKIDSGSDLHVWTTHFSSFATWSSTSTPASSTTSTSSGGGGGYGVGAGSSGGGGGGGGGSYGGILASSTGGLKIYQVSWDTCTKNMATILAGTNGDPSTLEVLARGTLGIMHTSLANSQPYADQNKNQNTKLLLYQFTLPSKETYFDAVAQDIKGIVTAPVTISGCSGTLAVSPIPQPQQPVTTPSVPSTPEQPTEQITQVPTPYIPSPTIVNNNNKPTTIPPVTTPTPSESTPQQTPVPTSPSLNEKQKVPQVAQPNQFADVLSHFISTIETSNFGKLVTETPLKYALLVIPVVVIVPVIILITRRRRARTKFVLPSSRVPKVAEERIKPPMQKTPPVMIEKPIVQEGKKEPMIMRGIQSEHLSQLEAAKRDLQECLREIDLTSNRLKIIKNEHVSASSLLESTKKEIDETMSELSALKSERQSIVSEMQAIRSEFSALKSEHHSLLSEMQSIRSERENLHPERQHEELQSVKEKVDAMKNDISSITTEMSEITREYVNLKRQISTAKSELDVLQSKKNEKEKEIRIAKNELAFIELELANVNKDENKKIIKAASSMVGAINSKYEETKKELEGLKATLAKIRAEYEAARSEERRN